MSALPKYLLVEAPFSLSVKVKATRLLGRTKAAYQFQIITSRFRMAEAWAKIAWRVLIMAARELYEPLENGGTYKVSVHFGDDVRKQDEDGDPIG
jgi:hypothetical protein